MDAHQADLLAAELSAIAPHIWLAVTAGVVLLHDILTGGKSPRTSGWISLAGLVYVASRLWDAWGAAAPDTTVFGMVRVDSFALLFQLLGTVGVMGVVVLCLTTQEYAEDRERLTGEIFFLLLCALLGIFFMASADHLLLVVLGVETLSLCSYALAASFKANRASAEAGLKYVLYGGVASGVMIYGISLLYGLTGSLRIDEMGNALAQSGGSTVMGLGLLLTVVGLGFKVALVPFHFWTPDVYEGSPTPVTTFLAVASKAGSFAVLLRFLDGFLAGGLGSPSAFAAEAGWFFAAVAAITMTYGNLAALRQTSLKRMLGYSSIAHAGYVAMGLALLGTAHWQAGLEAAVYYLAVYVFMNLLAFGGAGFLQNASGSDTIDDLEGLGWKAPWAAGMFAVALVSLTGLPPTLGFFGKWQLFAAVIGGGYGWLAAVAGINTAVSLFYYFGPVKALFLAGHGEDAPTVRAQPVLVGLLLLLTVWVLVGQVIPFEVAESLAPLDPQAMAARAAGTLSPY